jgi:DNA polymerase-4
MDAQLEDLAERVAAGLVKHEFAARTITVKARYPDFITPSRSRTFEHPVTSARQIGGVAKELLRQTEAGDRPVRLLGVTASNLSKGDPEQLRLFEEA